AGARAYTEADVSARSFSGVEVAQGTGSIEEVIMTTGNEGPRTVTVHGSAAGFAQQISMGPHRLAGDEPASVGGTDVGPGPYDLLLAALGSCTSMTVAMYARRKRCPLEAVTVQL